MEPWCRAALLGAVAWIALGCEPNASLPPPLHGRWVCSEARYAGRSLLLTASSVTFGTGGAGTETYAVRRVEAEDDPAGGLHYAIAYGAPGEGDRELSLHLALGARPAVRIGDRPERWRRAGPR
jgi:hypothetical protein